MNFNFAENMCFKSNKFQFENVYKKCFIASPICTQFEIFEL